MNNIRRSILFMLALVFLTSFAVSATADVDDFQFLSEKGRRFAAYNRDFVDFSKAHLNDPEYELINELRSIAATNMERIDSIRTLVDIYNQAVCKPDQLLVRAHQNDELKFYLHLIDADLEAMNLSLSYTKSPAVSQTAINMKDDLRDLKSRFEAMKTRE